MLLLSIPALVIHEAGKIVLKALVPTLLARVYSALSEERVGALDDPEECLFMLLQSTTP